MSRFINVFMSALLFCGVVSHGAGMSLRRVAGNAPKVEVREETVYITKTGKKYHRAGCRSLSRSMISISKEQAQQEGYSPCKICHPE